MSRILADHIADMLPALQDKITSRRNEASRELAALGDGRPDDPGGQAAVVLEKLHGGVVAAVVVVVVVVQLVQLAAFVRPAPFKSAAP